MNDHSRFKDDLKVGDICTINSSYNGFSRFTGLVVRIVSIDPDGAYPYRVIDVNLKNEDQIKILITRRDELTLGQNNEIDLEDCSGEWDLV